MMDGATTGVHPLASRALAGLGLPGDSLSKMTI